MTDTRVEYLLRLADTTLVLSQRLCEWCGKGPALEEDMALTNVALDLLGQARFWYQYAGELEGKGRDEDTLAFRRDAGEFRNLLLVEQPNGTYAETLARQFLFDTWHELLLQKLCASTDERIAGIAGKALKEVAYHVRRSSDLVVRLGGGTACSQSMMQQAFDELWPWTGEMFQADAVDEAIALQDIGPDPRTLREAWLSHVHSILTEATLSAPPADVWMQKGGRQGMHSEHLGYLLAEMQFLQRAYPASAW